MSDDIIEITDETTEVEFPSEVTQGEHLSTDPIDPVEIQARGSSGSKVIVRSRVTRRDVFVRARAIKRGDRLTGGRAWTRTLNADGTMTVTAQDDTVLWEGWPDSVVALRRA